MSWCHNPRPTFDDRDAAILAECIRERDAIAGPRVGDFVRMPDGSLRRFTHEWPEGLQTTVGPVHPCNGDSGFYLGKEGWVSFSGSLDRTIAHERIEATDETRDGSFWFFHHGFAGANLGVNCLAPCRIYRVLSVCPNCSQWVRPTRDDAGDCLNECTRRGFAH